MDSSISSSYRTNNKYLNQQIQKKFKNHHKKKKSIYIKRKKHIQQTPNHQTKHKHNYSPFVSLQQQCNELQYKPSTILSIKHYIKPYIKSKLNTESQYIIKHNYYYDLKDLISSNRTKIHKPSIKNKSNLIALYKEDYIQSNNVCKWIKLKCGTFFNFSFYIFNRDADIHNIELMKREQNQNIQCITYFIQNIIEEIYSNIILSHDVSFVIAEYCRGYLIGRCYNNKCNKDIKFFYEDRYIGVDTYFALSHDFEQNDIIYCSQCLLDEKVCKIRKCECGNNDFADQFNKYVCYKYEDKHDTIVIDEFKCDCIGHKTRCSRHKQCSKCKLTVCRECELFEWGLNKDGICTNCVNMPSECKGCKHIFNTDKLCQCTLCKDSYCDGIKWKTLDMDKDVLQDKYDTFLNTYKCECNWKEKYFDAAHNLWYPTYSEWQRRTELAAIDQCDINDTLKCMICCTSFAICNECDAAKNDDMFICDECKEKNTMQCNLCNTEYIHCIISYGDKYKGMRLDDMEERRCIECDDVCFICSVCYDECNADYFGLYLCLKCKENNKKTCMYCNEIFIDNVLWDKICGNKSDKFRYFLENERCKRCSHDIRNMCNECHDFYGLQCIHCVKEGICVQCNVKIRDNCSLCTLCFEEQCFITKGNNVFLSNIIDKKWKKSHSEKKRNRKKQRKKRLNKEGKFMYEIGYNGNDIDFGVIKISSKWRKYRKIKKKSR